MPSKAYELVLPRVRNTCVVFASPHSGSEYSAAFLERSVLDKKAIRSSEDAFVDVLFAAAPRFGAPFIKARAPRAYVDLNRASDELDPALIEGVRRGAGNPRISSGLGVVPRVVANGRAIYRGKLSRKEAEQRLEDIWFPYHARLQELLNESRAMFGEAILLDCHSMPHEAIETLSKRRNGLPDVVLGDRFGAAAAADVMDMVEDALVSAGLNVARNTPFAGAFCARHYGRPSLRQHLVQIEIDRSLYMDERALRPNENFENLRALLSQVIAQVAHFGRGRGQLAAE